MMETLYISSDKWTNKGIAESVSLILVRMREILKLMNICSEFNCNAQLQAAQLSQLLNNKAHEHISCFFKHELFTAALPHHTA